MRTSTSRSRSPRPSDARRPTTVARDRLTVDGKTLRFSDARFDNVQSRSTRLPPTFASDQRQRRRADCSDRLLRRRP